MVNFLLDIGYHHLAGIVRQFSEKIAMPAQIGILHVAHTSKSTPLIYDLMELFRADVVDGEVLSFFRRKKKPIDVFSNRDVASFIGRIKDRLYYMELQLTKFQAAVNRKQVFTPLRLPTRHDGRCSQKVDTRTHP